MEKGKEKLIKFMTDKEVFTELIQNAVDGCARHWAELIADHLLANGVTFAKDIDVPSKLISIYDRPPKLGEVVAAWNPKEGYRLVRWHGAAWEAILPKNVKMSIAYSPFYLQLWAPLPEPPGEATNAD